MQNPNRGDCRAAKAGCLPRNREHGAASFVVGHLRGTRSVGESIVKRAPAGP
jgi:hypothetical protein